MEKLTHTTDRKKMSFWQEFKGQFIRSTKLYYSPIFDFWRYIHSPGKKSPLKDLWRYMNTPYDEKALWGED